MFDPLPSTPISRLALALVKIAMGLVKKSKATSANPFYGLLLAASLFSPSEETAGLSFYFFGLRPMIDAAMD